MDVDFRSDIEYEEEFDCPQEFPERENMPQLVTENTCKTFFDRAAGEPSPAHPLPFETKSNMDVGFDEPPNLGVDLSKAQRLRKKRGCRGGKSRAAASYSSPSHANQ